MIHDVFIDPLRYVLGAGALGFAGLLVGLPLGAWLGARLNKPESES